MGNIFGSYKILVNEDTKIPHLKNLKWIASPDIKLPATLHEIHFSNISTLGKGKFGKVYLAKQVGIDEGLSFCVAIKYISKQLIYDTKSRERIQQELDILHQADYPFIIHCFGGFATKQCLAVTMEYCYGGELYHRIHYMNKMSESQAKFYFCEIALAIQYLHSELNIIYRDLKPENIMIDLEGHIKLCDFGLSIPVSNQDDMNITTSIPDGLGNPLYFAPELVDVNTTHSYPVDWWALGVIIYEMITNKNPFGNENSPKLEIFNKITDSTVNYPLLISFNLRSLLNGLLNKNPKKRFNWDNIKKHSWVKYINWDIIEDRKIIPPWLPISTTNQPNKEHFKTEEIILSTGNILSNAEVYCKDINLPGDKISKTTFRRVSLFENNLNKRIKKSIKIIPQRGIRTVVINNSNIDINTIEEENDVDNSNHDNNFKKNKSNKDIIKDKSNKSKKEIKTNSKESNKSSKSNKIRNTTA